jgi:VIT1/CCC1 family predicted Fe2+/Mn2+ transporter
MAADEAVHEEIVRALAGEGRHRLSGNFRAAVFGADDGLVSHPALVMGVGATGASPAMVLFAGVASLFAGALSMGALSMGAGELVSVRSQRELLDASQPTQITLHVAPALDLDTDGLVLIHRARGMSEDAAEHRAPERLGSCDCDPSRPFQDPAEEEPEQREHVALGTDLGATGSKFCFFASGAVIPILPYLVGLTGFTAMALALVLVGLLSGASPWRRGLRRPAIGYGVALAIQGRGLVFDTTLAWGAPGAERARPLPVPT